MMLYNNFRKNHGRPIIGAFAAGVVGVYAEPLFLICYMLNNLFKGKIIKIEFLLIYVAIIIHGVVMCYYTGYTWDKMFQQALLLFVVQFGYIQLYYYSHKNLEYWFGVYLQFVFVLAVLGIVEFFFNLLTGITIFPYTLDFRESLHAPRLRSIFIEAGHMSLFFMPGVSYIIVSNRFFKTYKLNSCVILIASFLTFSTSMYVGICLAIYLRFYKKFRRIKNIILIVSVWAVWSVTNFDYEDSDYTEGVGIRTATQKLIQSAGAFHMLFSEDNSPENFEVLNNSTYASLTNLWIAINSPYRLFGTGLGTHQQNYEALYVSDFPSYGLNKEDGYSLFSRLLSEFGYFGVALFFFFVCRWYNHKNILSKCFLIFIISELIKGGHYTLNCTMLFLFLYYQCSKNLVDEIEIDRYFNKIQVPKENKNENINYNCNI